MGYEQLIIDFTADKVGEIIVTDRKGRILYRNYAEVFTDEQWMSWSSFNLDMVNMSVGERWEISDRRQGSSYSVYSEPITSEDNDYVLHHIYNTSEYANLLRDVSRYSKDWKELSSFQGEILQHLSSKYMDCLPIVLKAFKLSAAALYIGRERFVEKYIIDKDDKEMVSTRIDDRSPFDVNMEDNIKFMGDERLWKCFLNDSTVNGVSYALFIYSENNVNEEAWRMYYNVLRLFLENSILREKIIYESEHDQLTGLSNKGKYLSMLDGFFPKQESIAIYNMDVNYLKRVNDTLGHEAGDALIVKSAKSILAVERNNVRGFRMGGDEFMLIAWDITEEEANILLDEWRKALDKLNEEDKTLECVIACGLAYGQKEYNLSELLKLADERMYENKVAIKISRGDDPDAR